MTSRDLEHLLAELREVSGRRAAAEPGTDERFELDDALRAVQERIRFWSDDSQEDDLGSE